MKRYFTPKEKKVIFFDMNDTLMDSRAALRVGFMQALEEFTARWNSGDANWTPQRAFAAYRKAAAKLSMPSSNRVPESADFRCLKEALKDAPFSLGERSMQLMHKRIKEIKRETAVPFPGVKEVLENLADRYRLAIITNGNRQQRIRQLQLMELDKIIPEERLYTPIKGIGRKPNGTLYRLALEKMDAKPSEGVMVGNSWRNDVFGSTRAGMDAVWVNRAKKSFSQQKVGQEKVIVIHRCKQLLELFH